METRWARRLGPCIAVIGAVAAIASTTSGAPPPIWDPPDCPGAPSVGARAAGAWFRLDPTLSGGSYVGQRLTLGTADQAMAWRMELDAESFAAEPRGGTLLLGTDDGRGTRLSLIDLHGACRWPIATSRDVIRAAVTTPDGTALVEHRVDRRTRADLGIWRRPLAGAEPSRLLPALPADDRFGPTWVTQLGWSDDGASLVVASCGEVACRYRVIPPTGGAVSTVADPALGSFVGMADGRLVVREACRGLPCPLVSVDQADGDLVVLEPAAGLAVIARDSNGRAVVIHEAAAGRLSAIRPDGADRRPLPAAADGLRLVPDVAWSASAAEHPAGRFLLGPDGRVPLDGPRPALLLSLETDHSVPLDEVSP